MKIEGKKGCFRKGTRIETPTGFKYIEDIKTNDIVVCFNSDGRRCIGTVTETFKHDTDETKDDFIKIKHRNGTLYVTVNHWILDGYSKKWREAGSFKADEYIIDVYGNKTRIISIEKTRRYKYSYNFIVDIHHTYIAEYIRVHNGGGGKGGGSSRTPIEEENTLSSRAVARVIDVLCEGEIEGLVDGMKSVYFDGVPVQSTDETYNFLGATGTLKTGTPDQAPVEGFPNSESAKQVSIKLTTVAPNIIAIGDDDVDDVRINFTIPALFQADAKTGDVKKTDLSWKIEARSTGGSWSDVKTLSKFDKCISAYQTSYTIQNIGQYGSFPIEIRTTRLTEDSSTTKKQNDLYISDYVEIKNQKFSYPDTAYMAWEVDSRQFGSRIPRRGYEIYATKVKYPSNYNPTTRAYDGVWDGTFTTGYTNNPAWIYYDIHTSDRYGLGLTAAQVDKWTLYAIGQYCDVLVNDGFGGTEPRFTFNGQINTREQAINVIKMIASNFRSIPLWSNGQATLTQDRPIDPVKLVTEANVINGFVYQGSSKRDRHTSINVSWNDPDDFYRLAIETVDDIDGIERYGYNPLDTVAYGCTSRGQARRYGQWLLETELNQTDIVTYQCSFDQADLIAGEVIKVQDQHYAALRNGGRIVSSTSNSITIDSSVTIDSLEDNTLSTVNPSGGVENTVVTNGSGSTSTLTISGSFDYQPISGAIWTLTTTSVSPRLFKVVSIKETERNLFEVTAVGYNEDKFTAIDTGTTFSDPPFSAIPSAGKIEPPTGLTAIEYSYEDTGNISSSADRKFAALVSWTHTRDPRMQYYQLQSKPSSGSYAEVVSTVSNSYDIRPITKGSWSFRIRALGFGPPSNWTTLSDISILADPNPLPDITNLVVLNGDDNDTWNGPDCEVGWDALDSITISAGVLDTPSGSIPSGSVVTQTVLSKLKDYKLEVMKTDDTLLRTLYLTDNKFVYTYAMNEMDNSGTALRDLKFRCSARDIYDKTSTTPTVLIADNPAPSMAGTTPTITQTFQGLKIDWANITPADNDLSKYKVYIDTSNPPTTEVAEVSAKTTYWWELELTPNTTYRAQVEPYDLFGAGTKSSVANGEPLKVGQDSIEGELTARLTYSDTLSTATSALGVLYDHERSSGGISGYGSGDWIKVEFPMESIFDRVSIWANKSFNCFVSYKTQETGAVWNYLTGEADHTLDSEGRLVSTPTSASAATNYWTADSGDGNINLALFPQGLIAKYVRLHILTATTTIYELVFTDQVIAEWIVANQLSAISADLGVIAAGSLQSTNLDSDEGVFMDLDNDDIKFGGTTDYRLRWNNGVLTLRSDDGKTVFTGNTMTVKDGSNTTRVKIGKLT